MVVAYLGLVREGESREETWPGLELALGLQPELKLRSPDWPAGSCKQPTLRRGPGHRAMTGRDAERSSRESENTALRLHSAGPEGAHTSFSPKEIFMVTCDFNDKQKKTTKSIEAHGGSPG